MTGRSCGRRPVVILVTAACGVLIAGGCGAPTGSPAEPIPSVPYGLTASPSPVPPSASPTGTGTAAVYLVAGEVLVATAAPPGGTGPGDATARVLARLAQGPDDDQRRRGLSTAFAPDVALVLIGVTGGRATVDIRSGEGAPSPGRLPLAVGQLVLTLTSVAEVDEVSLLADGTPVTAPLPGGAQTDRPLRAADYAELVGEAPS